MLLGVKPAKSRVVGLRSASRPKFNMHAFTGSSICKGVVLRFTMARKFTRFLQAHLLHWLEVLGWMGKTPEGIEAILSLEGYVLVCYLLINRSLINLSLGYGQPQFACIYP